MSNSSAEKVVWKPVQSSGGKEGTMPQFEVIVNSGEVQRWLEDKSVPLVDVVQRFEVYTHELGGSEGISNRASKAELQEAIGTSNTTEAIEYILQHGHIQPWGREGKHTNKDRGAPGLIQPSRGQGAATMPHGNGRAQVHG